MHPTPNGDGQGHITRRMGVHELSRLICCLLELLGLFCPIFRTVRFHMCIQQTCVSIYRRSVFYQNPNKCLKSLKWFEMV